VQAGAKRLVLTHLSARYSRDARDLEREARAVFPDVTIARDGMEVEISYEKEPGEDAEEGLVV
jgi:ribonuclease Z